MEKKEKAPLFHITKKSNMPLWQSLLIRFGFIVGAIIIGLVIIMIAYGGEAFEEYGFAAIGDLLAGTFGGLFKGVFIDLWDFLKQGALLLGVGLALIPAFKMKFWNLGGNGQILVGALATIACMIGFGGKLPDGVIVLISIPAAILAGAVWAVIPAIFKALFNTNESLFTLMMNYIAAGLVSAYIMLVYPTGSHVIPRQEHGHLPELFNDSLLVVIVALIVLAFMVYYLRFSKHGYELAVVGESTNTARYVGINVKKVIIRTLIVSGALCGLIGCLIAGGIDFTVNGESAQNMGFTAIMAVWLAKFNPLITVATSFFIQFITIGMQQVNYELGITSQATANLVIGLIYFFVIGCEFFIEYKVIFNFGKKKNALEGVSLEEEKPQEEKKEEGK